MKGVFQRASGRWGAIISRNNVKITLGTFDTEEESVDARIRAESIPRQNPSAEKMRMARSRYDETMAEIHDESRYTKKIQDRCFSCKKHIENSWEYYRQYGNFCKKCSGDASLRSKKL